MIRFVATDLDGTLLTNDKMISAANVDALRLAQQKGVILALASGRGETSLSVYAKQLDMVHYGGYLICNNGQKVVSLRDGTTIENPIMTNELVLRIFRFAKSHRLELFLEGDEGTSHYSPTHMTLIRYVYNRFQKNSRVMKKINYKSQLDMFGFPREHHLNHISNEHAVRKDYFKIGIAHSEQRIDQIVPLLIKDFGDELTIYRVNEHWVDLVALGVSKAMAIQQILEVNDIPVSQAMAIGDSENDLDMIQYVGIGVAVANAMPSVLAIADEVTLSNENDGVAAIILKHI